MSWQYAKLSEVAPSKPLKVKNTNNDQNIWQITLDHIESDTGKLLKKDIQPYSKAGSSTHWFDERYVLYSKLRPYLNKVILPDEKGIGTTELIPMLPDKNRLDRTYLAYYLRSPKFVEWVSSQTAGAKMPRVAMGVFWEHEIPLPPLPEQQRIAAILDKADAIRRKRQQALQLADEFLRSVFLEMFGDPVTNPKGWDVKPLGSLAEKIGSGSTPTGGKESYISEGVSLIRSLNIHDCQFLHKNLAFLTDKQANKLSNVVVEENDVLLNITGASVCRCAIVDNAILPARVNQHVCIIRAKLLVPEYLLYTLVNQSYKKLLMNVAKSAGATREAITKEQIQNLFLPVPLIELQREFARRVQKVEGLKAKLKASQAQAEAQFNALSQRAFAGEL
ncbi:restriction endonuclease subunit S [Thiothrix subterranea]|uniref:restriction endonuclease subunit S n=1 Tax=Thiothrix subterranea TaxID=2735563 RepID=UPI00192A9642|nr:restriction endonuclease subunit S [Thiothrix subterranea]QQZ28984.1 restriction endonuclease subunit S [Thiothrix subterranea]